MKTPFTSLVAGTLVLAAAQALPAAAQTPPSALPGYRLSVFAAAPAGLSAPDSIAVVGHHVWIAYGNGAPPDGSSGTSNIVEYSSAGQMLRNLVVAGHSDGLRLDARTKMLWALQNEDANPNLVLIDPRTGTQSASVPLPPVNGGGYDDPAFSGSQVFASASNPALDGNGVNRHPAIVQLIDMNGKYVALPVLMGDAVAINTVTEQKTRLNLTDPDSLILTPKGDLLLDDQGDGLLVKVQLGGGQGPVVSAVPLLGGVQLDDTVYATATTGTLLIVDRNANTVYALRSSRFEMNEPYSASTGVAATSTTPAVPASVGHLYLDSGALVPIVTGLVSPHGMAFRPHG